MNINNFNVSPGANVNIISDSHVTISHGENPAIEQKGSNAEIKGGDYVEPIEIEDIEPIDEEFNKLVEQGQEYFDDAVDEGYMKKTATGYEWLLSGTLLAYFIGRIYCNDQVEKDKFGETWVGEGGFPEKLVEKLFGNKNIGALRRNKFAQKSTPPKGYEKIDKLF